MCFERDHFDMAVFASIEMLVVLTRFAWILDIVQQHDMALVYRITIKQLRCFHYLRGWWGGATVLSKLPVSGHPTMRITVWQGPTALAVGAGGGCLDIFTLIYPFSPLSPLSGRRPDID